MIALGLSTLRLPPEQFWALTPRELAALAGGAKPSAMRRRELEALVAAYPDGVGGCG